MTRTIILAFCFLASSLSFGWCSSFGDLYNDIRQETKLKILESATPGYFYDFQNGRSKGGAVTEILAYRFLSGDAGWITPFDSKEVGTVVLGGSVHVDRMLAQYLPTITQVVRYVVVPNSARNFWDKLSLGLFGGHNFDTHSFEYGIYSGLKFDF